MTNPPGRRASRRRSEAHYSDERGDTYLIHFARKFGHARHYRGWTPRTAAERFRDHLAGQGANLTAKVAAAGIGMKLARIWPDTTRDYEDAIKHMGGARRICPECGAKPGRPRLATGTPRPPDERERLPWWELDRLGTTSDGEPLPYSRSYAEADLYAAQHPMPEVRLSPRERAEQAALDQLARSWTTDKEDPMALRDTLGRVFERRARAAERARRAERDRAHDEADRLAREADQIDLAAGRQPGQPLPLAAERAARVRDYIARDLVRDARAQAATRSPEPVLQGADLDAELGRLAEKFPEAGGPQAAGYTPYPEDVTDPAWGRDPHGLAADRYSREPDVCGHPGANGGDCGLEPAHDGRHQPLHRTGPGRPEAGEPAAEEPGAEPGPDAARRTPERNLDGVAGLEAVDAVLAPGQVYGALAYEADRPDHLYGAPGCDEGNPEAAHFGWDSPEAQDRGSQRLPVIEKTLSSPRAWRDLAPEAATLPDGTPHSDPYLAGRGWQAQGGIYARAPQMQAEAG